MKLLVLVSVLVFGYVLLYMGWNVQGDYSAHIGFAMRISEQGVFDAPHVLYHILVIALARLVPFLGMIVSGFIVCLVFYVATPIVLFRLIRPDFNGVGWRPSIAAFLTTIMLVVASHVNIFTLSEHNLYRGYIPINAYHNPTMLALKPFALLSFAFVVGVLLKKIPYSRSNMAAGIILVTLCMLAKPNYIICLAPAVFIVACYKLMKREPLPWRLLIGISIPVVMIMILQYVMAFGNDSTGIAFSPLSWFTEPGATILLKLILSALLPIWVLAVYWRTAVRNLGLIVCWLTFAIGMGQAYLLTETGERAGHGNFLWSAQITLFLLLAYSVVFLIKQKPRGWKRWGSAAILALHLMSGVVFLFVPLATSYLYQWW